MPRFEYLVQDVSTDHVRVEHLHKEHLDWRGKDGWELVSVHPTPGGSSLYLRHIYKRAIGGYPMPYPVG